MGVLRIFVVVLVVVVVGGCSGSGSSGGDETTTSVVIGSPPRYFLPLAVRSNAQGDVMVRAPRCPASRLDEVRLSTPIEYQFMGDGSSYHEYWRARRTSGDGWERVVTVGIAPFGFEGKAPRAFRSDRQVHLRAVLTSADGTGADVEATWAGVPDDLPTDGTYVYVAPGQEDDTLITGEEYDRAPLDFDGKRNISVPAEC